MKQSKKIRPVALLTKLPLGTFVVFGAERAPEVHSTDTRTQRMLNEREAVSDRLKAVEYTFGTGMQYALPAHSLPCMEFIALNYVGPFQRELRGLCAAISLGEPFNPEPGGGLGIKDPNPKPPPRGPASAKVKHANMATA